MKKPKVIYSISKDKMNINQATMSEATLKELFKYLDYLESKLQEDNPKLIPRFLIKRGDVGYELDI